MQTEKPLSQLQFGVSHYKKNACYIFEFMIFCLQRSLSFLQYKRLRVNWSEIITVTKIRNVERPSWSLNMFFRGYKAFIELRCDICSK
jgi:hypothetical protein